MMQSWHRRAAVLLAVLLWLPHWTLARNEVPRGLQEIALAALPAEAQHTIDLIRRGGPFPYQRDGVTFGNHERLLPERKRGYYREYTVPTPGAANRGARRIVAGGAGAEFYYTGDHYRSFQRVRE
jgi:ribonuclease T1